MYILGITCYGHDASAAIVKDGKLVTAVEEERFNRRKHTFELPVNSIRHCLSECGIGLEDVEHIGYYIKPWIGYPHYFLHFLKYFPESLNLIRELKVAQKKKDYIAYGLTLNPLEMLGLPNLIREKFDIKGKRPKFHFLEHHLCHVASSYLISPFEEAAILSIDGCGEWTTTMLGYGRGDRFEIFRRIYSPHSLGVFYNSVCVYLGFSILDGPGKVMGLASYGDPERYYKEFKKLVRLGPNGSFEIDLSYFRYHVSRLGQRCSQKFIDTFGPPRRENEPLNQHHNDIAAVLQRVLEESIFHILYYLKDRTKSRNLCMAGGVALNSVANGKVLEKGIFDEVFVQPAASDAGCSIGAAFYIYNMILGYPRKYVLETASLGKEFSQDEMEEAVKNFPVKYERSDDIAQRTAQLLSRGKIVGWFQGRAEFGPRALGSRSILADPRIAEMKDILNERVKHREGFRPYAPSVLAERAEEYFDNGYPSPYMLLVYNVKPEKRNVIPAVTHVDGTGRVQTVEKEKQPLFWRLIKEFERLTGVGVILNTSFNVQGMPIVNSPKDALECFLSTEMDNLVLGNILVSKK
ncbi:MAG: carbamoyltransferase [Candidatus Omnitrophica bacterium]|nr:carbamoyltransferase [Candidatus Omnitrophota bacterium]